MYHSKANKFNIVDATPFGRDPMKELAKACKKHGLGLGFYYSHNQDWTFPGGGNGPKKTEDGRNVDFKYYQNRRLRLTLHVINCHRLIAKYARQDSNLRPSV